VDSRAAAVRVAAKYLVMGAVFLALATAGLLSVGVGGFGQIKVLVSAVQQRRCFEICRPHPERFIRAPSARL
jgi:hypothetical protein